MSAIASFKHGLTAHPRFGGGLDFDFGLQVSASIHQSVHK
jgi:hypothetical protein